MTKDFWSALAKRAAWTFCETCIALIPVGIGVDEVNWRHVLSVSLLAAILSGLKSIVAGLPEVKEDIDERS